MTNSNLTSLYIALGAAALAGTLVSCSGADTEPVAPPSPVQVVHTEQAQPQPTEAPTPQPTVTLSPSDIPTLEPQAQPVEPVEVEAEPVEAQVAEEPAQVVALEPVEPTLPTCAEGFALAEDLSCVPSDYWDTPTEEAAPSPELVNTSAYGTPCGDGLGVNTDGNCTLPLPGAELVYDPIYDAPLEEETAPEPVLEAQPTEELPTEVPGIPAE